MAGRASVTSSVVWTVIIAQRLPFAMVNASIPTSLFRMIFAHVYTCTCTCVCIHEHAEFLGGTFRRALANFSILAVSYAPLYFSKYWFAPPLINISKKSTDVYVHGFMTFHLSGRGTCCNGTCQCETDENGYLYRSERIANTDCNCDPLEVVCFEVCPVINTLITV